MLRTASSFRKEGGRGWALFIKNYKLSDRKHPQQIQGQFDCISKIIHISGLSLEYKTKGLSGLIMDYIFKPGPYGEVCLFQFPCQRHTRVLLEDVEYYSVAKTRSGRVKRVHLRSSSWKVQIRGTYSYQNSFNHTLQRNLAFPLVSTSIYTKILC